MSSTGDGPGIVVTGAAGRMGAMLVRTIAESGRAHLSAALERPGHPSIGEDAGTVAGGTPVGVTISADALEAVAHAQAVIDFTTPSASVEMAGLAAQAKSCHVIGTTGFSAAQIDRLHAAARHAVIVREGNMSLGVNLLSRLTRQVARALGEDWDVEVMEAHHSQKLDAPSGTALMLGEAAAAGRGTDLAWAEGGGRGGQSRPRAPGGIGFAVIRGGDIVGEHDVIFAGKGERVVLRHIATDRAIFARGALAAALWAQERSPGHYGMADVLGLN